MFTTDNTHKRLDRLRAIEARDQNRLKPNPLGPGFLTRSARYNEVRWELQRRLRQAEQIPGCVWRNAALPFADNH
jgi:hypothetical protein